MSALTNNTVQSTYQSLLKTADNGIVGSTLKNITDGFGNPTALSLDDTVVSISGSLIVNGIDLVSGSVVETPFLNNVTEGTNVIRVTQNIINPGDLLVRAADTFIIQEDAEYLILGTLTNNGSIIVSGSLIANQGIIGQGSIAGPGTVLNNNTVVTYDKANRPYGFPQLNEDANLAITGSVEITGSLILTGKQVVSASSVDPSALDMHIKDDGLWAFRIYNDTYSTSSIGLASWIDNSGISYLGTEINKPLYIYNNGQYYQPTLIISSSGVTVNDNLTVTGSVSITGSLTLNGVTGDLRPYKVYTALLTQSGNSVIAYINSDDEPPVLLTIGVTYTIIDNTNGFDLTNVGAPNNDVGTIFTATGTTPNNWGNGYVSYDTGAPVVTVLENTIGNIYWTYDSTGLYFANSTGAFPDGKTYQVIGDSYDILSINRIEWNSPNVVLVQTLIYNTLAVDDSLLDRTPIEIRVYN